jgi:hypothetical protein
MTDAIAAAAALLREAGWWVEGPANLSVTDEMMRAGRLAASHDGRPIPDIVCATIYLAMEHTRRTGDAMAAFPRS